MVLTKNLLFLLLVGLPTWAAAQRTTIDESVILAYMKTHNIPGLSVAIAINGEITYAEGFGVKNTAQEPVTQGTIFQAASISKSLTSVLILRLVQEGKINLDAPVNTYLKGWQLEADKEASIPSVAQLLNHTGGTNVHGFLGYRHSRKGLPDLTSILNGSRHTHLWEPKIQVKDPPNTTFSYSGGGYCVLQKAILDTEAGSFQAQMQRQIFGPCGMKSSFFSTALTPQEEQRIAFGYKDNGKPLRAEYHVYPQMAAAGLWTTPSDLVGFLTHIQQSMDTNTPEPLLNQENFDRMLTRPVLEDGTQGSYGLGFYVLNQPPDSDQLHSFHHFGNNQGFSSYMGADVEGTFALAIMCNRNSVTLDPLRRELMRQILEIIDSTEQM